MAGSPPFLFRILGMREAPGRLQNIDALGNWSPPKSLGSNIWNGEDSGVLACIGSRIAPRDLPREAQPYKTMSIYYSGDRFYLVPYDAKTATVGDGVDGNDHYVQEQQDDAAFYGSWQEIHFEWNDQDDYSSFVTYAGEHTRLRTQRPDQTWARMLLPSRYHALQENMTAHTSYGGMNGDLPLILALVAFSIRPERLRDYFTQYYNGVFGTHREPHGRQDRRGMVVQVWSWPPYSNSTYLDQYERGEYGNIFP